jgi:hypothetical protein
MADAPANEAGGSQVKASYKEFEYRGEDGNFLTAIIFRLSFCCAY